MSTTPDNRDPDEIQQEIHRTQDEMSRTVDRLGDQFTLRSMVNSLLDKADDNDVDARAVIDGARRNPLALGLISAGTIWLLSDHDARASSFTSDKSKDRSGTYDHTHDSDPDHRGYIEHMSRVERRPDEDELAYCRRRDYARGTYLMIERDHEEDDKSYRKRLDEATNRMREKRDQFADSARERRHRMADSARGGRDQVMQGGRSAARKGRNAYYENPLLGGLAAALVGAVAGAATPISRTEREQLGPQGSRMIDQAEAKAREAGEQAKHKKDEMVDKADSKMQDNNGSQKSQPVAPQV